MGDGCRAITLWPEWAWAVRFLDKRVENRTWHPPRDLIGKRLAIHAGKSIGGRPSRKATEDGLATVVGMAEAAGWEAQVWGDGWRLCRYGREPVELTPPAVVTSAVVCTAVLTGVDDEMRTGWDVPDSWHWRLDDVQLVTPPERMPGAQGLWCWTPGFGVPRG